MLLTIVIFILTLGVLVLSHEFGHFYSAKKFGVKILEFGFGLPPRAWGKKIGETIYSLNWLPIGGFVRLFGEDETDKNVLKDNRSFAAKPVWQRIIIAVAGVVVNLLLAVVLFWIVLASQGFKQDIPLIIPHQFIGADQKNDSTVVIGGVAKDSPAEKAGIKAGDRIIAFNGITIDSGEKLTSLTKQSNGTEVDLMLESPDNQKRDVKVTPRVNPPAGQGAIGVQLATVSVAHLTYTTLSQRIFSGITNSYNLVVYSFEILGRFISASFATHSFGPVSGAVSGPVGITEAAHTILQTSSPVIPYLNFVALLSLNLAIVNILPFPALDGGRIFFLLIEAIFQRRVNANFERWVHTIGMVILLTLTVVITFSDLKKLFS